MFPQHQLTAATTTTATGTGSATTTNPQLATAAAVQLSDITTVATTTNHSSKTEALKRTAKIGYEFCKSHASKIAQIFSVRN